MTLRLARWRTRDGEPGWLHPPLPDPLLALLGALAGGVWAVDQEEKEVVYPLPGRPVCVHRFRWRLLWDGAPAGVLKGELEEGGLNMAWSTFQILSVEARLADGRALCAEDQRRALHLSATGFTEAALRAAAEAVGLEVRG